MLKTQKICIYVALNILYRCDLTLGVMFTFDSYRKWVIANI